MTETYDDGDDAGNGTQPTSLRDFIKEKSDELDVDPGDLLIQSERRDPMYKGTSADHAKAEWFAKLWQHAVDGRDDDSIHVRGVHYVIVMAQQDGESLNWDEVPVDGSPGAASDLDTPVTPPTNCSWSEYRNTQKCYDYLEEAAVLARILGYVPLDGVHDRKHDQIIVTRYSDHRRTVDPDDLTTPTGIETPSIPGPDAGAETAFDDPEDVPEFVGKRVAQQAVDRVRFDRPSQAPFHVELWSEKGIPDYLHTFCEEAGVNAVVEGQGDLSLSIAHEFVQRVESAEKPAVVLYLSDFDPKGDNMAAAMSGKIAWLQNRGDLTERVVVEQLALTQEQVIQYGFPRKPISESDATGTGGRAYDTLVDDWERRKGVGATELNVLENYPDLYKQIVAEGLSPYIDTDLPDKNEAALAEWRDDVADTVAAAVREAGVHHDLDDLRDWMEQFDARLADAQPILDDLRDLKRDGAYRDWVMALGEVVSDADLPRVDVPEGEGRWPDDPLYDSERGYGENVVRIKEHRNGE